ncbi:pseudouridylate synthase 4 [Moniliophthora roreri]|nr:pseudouridylate synthase 4 [Moniliophthora roreri]
MLQGAPPGLLDSDVNTKRTKAKAKCLADHRKKNLRSDHIPNHKHDALFSNSPDSKSSFGGKVPLAALQVASPSEMV